MHLTFPAPLPQTQHCIHTVRFRPQHTTQCKHRPYTATEANVGFGVQLAVSSGLSDMAQCPTAQICSSGRRCHTTHMTSGHPLQMHMLSKLNHTVQPHSELGERMHSLAAKLTDCAADSSGTCSFANVEHGGDGLTHHVSCMLHKQLPARQLITQRQFVQKADDWWCNPTSLGCVALDC